MFTRWLITLTACLAVSANAESGAVTVAPSSGVKGQPETELTLNCGDGERAGVVQLWHTPFGDLHTPGVHSELEPVFMLSDGSLVIPRASSLHSGLYYCLLQDTEGTTLWPYQLHVGHDPQEKPELRESEHHSRSRRDAGSEAQRQAAVSDEQLAGAVAASVLLTFVVGFAAGALSRSQVLRCLRLISTRMRLPRKQECQTAGSVQRSEVTRTSFPSTYNNHAYEMEEVQDDCTDCVETRTSPPPPLAPAKPKRSFRIRQEEEQETPLYLEGCECIREEEEEKLEEEAEGRKEVSGETEEEQREFYLLEDGGSQSVADEEEEEEEGGRENETNWRNDEAETDREERRGHDKKRDEEQEGSREEGEKDSDERRGGEEDEEQENTRKGEGGGEADTACSPRRTRVIRLYQYDDDGQRYCHLPSPAPEAPVAAPRLKHRSLSLTRLNAIMAAASAGPMDTRQEEGEERPRFSMDI